MKKKWQKVKRCVTQYWLKILGIIIIVAAIGVFIYAAYKYRWDWTGISDVPGKQTTVSTSEGAIIVTEVQLSKTLWDWLQLFIVPAMLAIGGYWLNELQKRRGEKAAEQRTKTEQEIARDNQRESALQGYIDKLSELLIHGHLAARIADGGLQPEYQQVRNVARVRTITILTQLDGRRVGYVFAFLREAGLLSATSDDNVISLKGADFREVNWSKANLKEANLSGVEFNGANLSEASLWGANLSEVYLSDTNLSKAFLMGADLNGATLHEANLSGAHLNGANLNEAGLVETNLSEADLSKANLSRALLMGANLSGADLFEANLSGAHLNGTNFQGANLSFINLSSARLWFANLSRANLWGANLSGAVFLEADLTEAYLWKADLNGANLSGANLSGANFSEANLSRAKLDNADLNGANLKDVTGVTTEQLVAAKSLQGATMPDGSKHI